MSKMFGSCFVIGGPISGRKEEIPLLLDTFEQGCEFGRCHSHPEGQTKDETEQQVKAKQTHGQSLAGSVNSMALALDFSLCEIIKVFRWFKPLR